MADKSGKFTDEWGKSVARDRYGKPHEPLLSQTPEEAPQSKEDKISPLSASAHETVPTIRHELSNMLFQGKGSRHGWNWSLRRNSVRIQAIT